MPGNPVSQEVEKPGSGSTTRQGFSVSRNAAGMIDKIVYLDDGSPDSLTITVSSNGQRYTKAVESLTRFSSTRTTTTEFVYDNAGRIIKTQRTDDIDGNQLPGIHNEFVYQNNNLIAERAYQDNNNILYQNEYTYDNKNNPVPFGNEWILYSLTFTTFYERSSANNATKVTFRQPGSADETVTATYTYNAQNFPLTVTSTTPNQPAVTGTYTYE